MHAEPVSRDAARETDSHLLAEEQLRLARVWERMGRSERARRNFERALWLEPDHAAAIVELGRLLLRQAAFVEAVELYGRALESQPNEAAFHKGLADALDASGRLEEAYARYRLEPLRSGPVEIADNAVLCCLVVRNEAQRLPFFLSYYRALGVDRFLVVDNASSDATAAFLSDQPDVYCWRSDLSFNRANFGSAWFELLLRRYGIGHWVVMADIDELLCYPDCETVPLRAWCARLDREGRKAFEAVLLDMYSDRPLNETHYRQGQDYREVCCWFDREFCSRREPLGGPFRNQTAYFGGVRQRVFGNRVKFLLSKVPLLKYGPATILTGGQHWTNCPPDEMARESGALLHFKFFSSFRGYVESEVERGEHFGAAEQYQAYQHTLRANRGLRFHDPRHSERLRDSAQLVRLGVMRTDDAPAARDAAESDSSPPVIDALAPSQERPLWSVMITVYDRVAYLPRALRSVLDQAAPPGQMEITVVADCPDEDIHARIRAIVDESGAGRVDLWRTPGNAGHPEVFNLCVRRARGYWVHILHDDDWVLPGYYRALELGIEAAPAIGAAFSRGIQAETTRHSRWVSYLERETPGVIEDWTSRIGLNCRMQFSSMAVRREVYERLGGFRAQAGSAFDWDMWKRIAIHYPVWFEPEILARSEKDGRAATDALHRSGAQVADALRSIDLSEREFPSHFTAELSARAREHFAQAALDIARSRMDTGEYEAALANIAEGLRCTNSPAFARKLLELLAARAT